MAAAAAARMACSGWNGAASATGLKAGSARVTIHTIPATAVKRIYDPASDAWYWLDNIQNGAMAASKDVYQESNGGKWVRYDETATW